MTRTDRLAKTIELIVLVLLLVISAVGTGALIVKPIQEANIMRTTESRYNTAALESWCGGSVGKIRMIGAWYYDTHDGVVTVEDEQGNLWRLRQDIGEEDFLLLWLDDMGTPSNPTDDVVVQVWTQTHS